MNGADESDPSGSFIGHRASGVGVARADSLRCATCGQAPRGENRSFCPRDGTLLDGPFVLGERYRIEELIGSGGTSFVFGARHLILGKSVAVKVLRPEVSHGGTDEQRFVRHARLASQLSHENIVGTIDFGHDSVREIDYLVMERVTGPTLAQEIARSAPFAVERTVGIVAQICRALVAAHAHGVVHRDLNPKNVILTETSGRTDFVKLCDFGLSRAFGGNDRVTQTGTFVGTPAYMAPEQMESSAEHGPAVDIYALGVTAYEMLTGLLPFEASNPVALIASKWRERPIPLHERTANVRVPQEIESFVMQCLETDSAKRPASAADAERTLHSWLSRDSRSGSSMRAPVSSSGTQLGMPMAIDLIGQTIGSYTIKRQLGAGGVGSVYYAEHNVIGSKAAIKVLLPEMRAFPGIVERFIQEARSAGEIGDLRIAKYFDFGYLPDGRPYAVMEYLEGHTLSARIEAEGPMSLADAVAIMRPVAGALAKAHGLGIIHRDLKPENLFLTDPTTGTNVKVLDFGIAKVMSPQATFQTGVGLVAGTLAYAAPEQLFGQSVTPASDVYAFGATLYEVLTGVVPFHDELDNLIMAKSGRAPRSPRELRPSIPERVASDILGMLTPQASERVQSMTEVESLMAGWMAGASASARAAEPVRVDVRAPSVEALDSVEVIAIRRAPIYGALLAAVTLALAGGAIYFFTGRAVQTTGSVPSSTSPESAHLGTAPTARKPSAAEPPARSSVAVEPSPLAGHPSNAPVHTPNATAPAGAVTATPVTAPTKRVRGVTKVRVSPPTGSGAERRVGPLVVDPFAN